MHAAHYREEAVSEAIGALVLGAIAMFLFVAFAISPLGTLAALLVGSIAYLSIGRGETGSAALRVMQRVSLTVAACGVAAAFVLF